MRSDMLDTAPATWAPKRPSAAQIAAVGRALPDGAHTLSEAQQRAWFGRVVFDAPVSWDGDAFMCGGRRVTPAEVAR